MLDELVARDMLVPFVPRTNKRPWRRLYLAPEARRALEDPHSSTNMLSGEGRIRAALAHFATDGLVFAGPRGRGGFMKELDPPPADLWEIRVVEPRVQSRLLSAFIARDCLVLMRFHTRPHLGDRGSAAWQEAMRACDETWRHLFGAHPRLHGTRITEYLSDHVDDIRLNR